MSSGSEGASFQQSADFCLAIWDWSQTYSNPASSPAFNLYSNWDCGRSSSVLCNQREDKIPAMADQEEEELDEQEQLERDELDREIRINKALQTMEKELHVSQSVVKPVLLKLLKMHCGNWEHIEGEGYRLLSDVIFEEDEKAEAEKAPGSSSGRKPAGKKDKNKRATPRRAPRNSKRAESDDSDDHDHSPELIRRGKRVPVDASTYISSVERGAVARRGRAATTRRTVADDDDDPAWEPQLALPSPASQIAPPQQCQEPQNGAGRRELRRISTGVQCVDKATQTEEADFEALAHQQGPISPTAIVCYEDPMPAGDEPPAPVPQDAPVYLPAAEVRRQIFCPTVAPLKSNSRGICEKCVKPKPRSSSKPPEPPLLFDPSRVKIEGHAAPSNGKLNSPQLVCLNPEPLQSLLPTSPPRPVALAVLEPPVQHPEPMDTAVIELPSPEPLLLTFPSVAGPDRAKTSPTGVSTPLVPPPPKLPTRDLPKILVPCSVQPPIELPIVQAPTEMPDTTNAEPSMEPKEDTSSEKGGVVVDVVENPLVEVKVGVEPSSKVGVEGKVVEMQQPTENSVTALAALASYSDDEDTDMSPKCDPREGTSALVGEGVEQERGEPQEEAHGVLPLDTIIPSVEGLDNILPTLSGEVGSEMVPSLNGLSSNGGAQEESKQSPDNTSSGSSKKRKRHLIKNQQEQDEQEEQEEEKSENRKQRYEWDDISRGKEKVPVSLSASHGGGLPKDFYYINSSVVFQSAHVGISMARIGEDDRCSSCVGNCLDNRTPCECARMTNGVFAYSVEGYLCPHFLRQELQRKADMKFLSFCQPGACPVERTNDEPCKGHIQRRFIKECWEKCGCTQLCGNRIVQRGIAHKLQVFWTEGRKGWGLRTLEHLPAGTFVCEYVGEILTNTEMWYRNNDVHRAATHSFVVNIDADWNSEKILKDEEALCFDGTYYGNVSRFINHRCGDSNLFDIPVEIESPDHHYYHLAFFTCKDVNENEELTWDYGLDFSDNDHQLRAFDCLCGSSLCRGKGKDGKPWM